MPKNKKCQYYNCTEPVLENSEKGYCIFHEPSADKDIRKFIEGIKRKLDNKDYDFGKYWFPVTISFLTISLNKPFTPEGKIGFIGFTFEGEANFTACTFKEKASFIRYTFKERVSFERCTFKGMVFFAESTFKQGANFSECTFERWANFSKCIFEGWGSFTGCTFKETPNFERCIFKERANFKETIFEKVIFLDNIKIEDPTDADILFRKAKTAWHREGNYVEEGKCHYQEMDYIRKQKKWYIRHLWANLFHRLLHGYGEKPYRVILWAVAIITGCALLFMNFGIGETRFFGEGLPTYNIFKIIFKLYNLSLTDLANIGRYFYFSVVTFTTLGYGDLRPVHPISHLISSIEAFTGMFMMALFVLTFGRKWRR